MVRDGRSGRGFVKSRSYRSHGEDGDHGDDDEASGPTEGSVGGWRRAVVGVEESRGKVCRTAPRSN